MPGSNFYNALANARQQTEKLKQQKLAEINAASGALANERSAAADRQAKADMFDRQLGLEREKMGVDSRTRDQQFANALEIAHIGAGTRKDIAGEGNKTKLSIAEQQAQNRLDVEGTRQGGAYQRTQMQQEGAGDRLDKNLTVKQSEGAMERGSREAMHDSTIQSREKEGAANRSSREGMNEKNNALKQKLAEAEMVLEKGIHAERMAQGAEKLALQSAIARHKSEMDNIRAELKINEGVLTTPEDKQSLKDRLPGSLKPSFNQPVAPAGIRNPDGSQFAQPGQDMTDAPDEDMEPLTRSMMAPDAPPAAPTPQPAVPQSQGKLGMMGKALETSGLSKPQVDPKSKEGRVARLQEHMIALVRADKAAGMTPAQISQKNAAGEYDRMAREEFNKAGLEEAKTKNNAVTGAPVEQALEQNETTDMMGNTVEPSWSNLPQRVARGIGGMFAHAGAGAIDTVTGKPIEAMKPIMMKGIEMSPFMDEREKANEMAKVAGMRGTNLSSLSNAATQTEARNAGLTEAAVETAGLVLPKPVGKGASAAAGWVGKKFPALGNTVKGAGEWLSSKVGNVLNRDVTDLTGKKAAQEAAEKVAREQAEAAAIWGKPAQYTGAPDAGASDFAKAVRGEVDDAASTYQKEMELGALEPQPVSAPPKSGQPWQMNAPQQPVVQVDPNTGVKTIVIETPQGVKTLPLDVAQDAGLASGVNGMPSQGRMSMTGPQAGEVQNAAQLYQNPVNYPDPLMYDSVAKPPTSFSQALTKTTPPEPMPPTKPVFGGGGGDKFTPNGINKRHAVLQQQVEGEKAMDAYRAMKETYVPSGAPEQPGLRAFAKEEMDQVFAPGNVVGAETSNITVAPAMQQAAKMAGIHPDEVFKLIHEVPLDQLPRGASMETPEGANAFVKALLNYRTNKRISDFYANDQGYHAFTGGL